MPKAVVLVIGNPLLAQDSLPLRIMPKLQAARPDVEFLPFEPTREDLPQHQEMVLLDTIQGLKKVRVLSDMKKLEQSSRAFSLHDFDLGAQLMLMDKFGLLGKTIIIGVPQKGDEKKIMNDVLHELETIFPFSSRPI